jgi:hypothetical protein
MCLGRETGRFLRSRLERATRRMVARMSVVREWVAQRKRVFVAMLLGLALGTILWFALSPSLNDEQEDLVGWLLTGSYLVAVVVSLLLHRARRNADRAH